ncbi:amino acid transporter [Xylona heveae TC161]|uniref:Amino acid transporter n=1 Tax=Xylona heveae (strain CBS 132557 / TC161) TaxID=1328760 RepID=A0A165JD82_XYLHT|nr:amino acid transporter [Xylona heveae TC161]KZF26082.1 amino acid transporter [Xylona heveae TC161]
MTKQTPRVTEGLHQKLNSRHLTFISLGSVIGTGIFLGIGSALTTAGPVGLVLGYVVICSVVFCVMLCVGEMVTYLPVVGAHLRLSGRFVDPALSAAMSWNYWYCWALIAAAETSAVAVLVTYWTQSVPGGVWIALCLALALAVNLCGPRLYAEVEFYMSTIKVITIVGLIILSIVLDAGGGPSHDYIGFRYWKNPGPFVQYEGIGGSLGRFLGFFSGLTTASFSSIGAEMLALASAETRNPRKILPTALRATWIRVLLFYFLGAFCVSLIVPSDDSRLGSSSTASASPYVIAIQQAGIKALPSIINACIITSAVSATVSDIYTASRTLHSMAGTGFAPNVFSKTTTWGSPWLAVLATWAMSLLAFLAVGSSSTSVFNFFLQLTALAGIITWLCIAVTYLRFRAGMNAQGISRASLPFKNRFTCVGAYWIIVVISSVLLFSGWPVFRKGKWDTTQFFGNYLPIGVFVVVFTAFKVGKKSRFVRASEMDLTTGLDEIERRAAQANEEEAPRERKRWSIRMKHVFKRLVS